jgi:hypothetical protein
MQCYLSTLNADTLTPEKASTDTEYWHVDSIEGINWHWILTCKLPWQHQLNICRPIYSMYRYGIHVCVPVMPPGVIAPSLRHPYIYK